ncbi:alanine racemase [Rubrivirga marina]|uniref:Alanine racemase n=1 Tax=Rubrivirga marina TaxID=1196024 RepID=A0A271IZR0_9BACT|nr:alanine racemase [Rubrivirga marina]PAP76726.1 alanine racemase [Rubrivirga marina]
MSPERAVALRAEVDLSAIRHNVRQLAGRGEIMGVVKADGYGHGAVPVSRVLIEEGVGWLAVATVPEAAELREAGVQTRILVLAAPLPDYLPAYEALGLDAVVSSVEVADAVIGRAPFVPVHVKVDTGMHRLGVPPEEAAGTVRRLTEAGVEVVAVWTHLATADADDPGFALEQVRRFDGVLRDLGADAPPLVHVANGPAHVRLPPLTSRPALVRLGGVLYGLDSDRAMTPDTVDLRPAMRLVSRVVHLQTVPPGESVSYGRTWTAERPTVIATLAVGYADGIPRALSNRGAVGIRGARYPIVGRVCMDMTMVSLGDPDGAGREVRRGDESVLFGRGGPSAEQTAAAAGTIPYELTTGLTRRVPRIVSDG